MEIDKQDLDPVIAEMERRWKESGIPGLYEGGSGPVSRERARCIRALLYPKPKLEHGPIENMTLPGPDGQPLALRIVRPPAGTPPSATLVYFHGGGWIVGDLDSHEAHAIRIANRTGAVVVMVDYRLAPEHPFPAGYEDCLAATRWASAQRAELGGASRPLALGGDSAGGNFAAAVALACRDAGIAVAVQLLLYPATDLVGDPNAEVMRAYIPQDAERVMRDPRASPARGELAGVAPVILGVGPHDFLYKDNLAFATKLREAGVPLTLRQFPTLNHGFFSYTAISADCAAAAELLCEDLRRALTATP